MQTLRLLMLAGLALIAGIWLWMGRDGNQPAPLAVPAPPSATIGARESGNQASVHTPLMDPAMPPLPSPELPLRDAVAALQLRADAGDSLAACRLGTALLRCQWLPEPTPGYDAQLAQHEASMEHTGDLENANRIAMVRLYRAELRRTCESVPAALVAKGNHYIRQAALAGEPEAMIRYASGNSLMTGHINSWTFINSPAFDVWRREARPVLMRALDAGVPEAAVLLAEAHGPGGGWLTMLLEPDHMEARASQALLRRLFGEETALERLVVPHTNDPGLNAAADALAAEWHDRGFGGERLLLAESTALLHALVDPHLSMGEPTPWPGNRLPDDCSSARRPAE
jgi:hypothetical protein